MLMERYDNGAFIFARDNGAILQTTTFKLAGDDGTDQVDGSDISGRS